MRAAMQLYLITSSARRRTIRDREAERLGGGAVDETVCRLLDGNVARLARAKINFDNLARRVEARGLGLTGTGELFCM